MNEPHAQPADPDPVRTGIPDVDAVLESVEELDSVDVAGHAAVYEAAHDRLRRALDAQS